MNGKLNLNDLRNLKILRSINAAFWAINSCYTVPMLVDGPRADFPIILAPVIGVVIYNGIWNRFFPRRSVMSNAIGNILAGIIGLGLLGGVRGDISILEQISRLPVLITVILTFGWFFYLLAAIPYLMIDHFLLKKMRATY